MIASPLCACMEESVLTKSMTLNATVVEVGVEETASSVSLISFLIYRGTVAMFNAFRGLCSCNTLRALQAYHTGIIGMQYMHRVI